MQEDLSLLGHEQQLAKAARTRRQIKAGVAHGTGMMPVTAPPPPSWGRGGHSWIYDQQYGDMVRPTDSVWCDCNTLAECKEKCGKAEEVPRPPPPPPPLNTEPRGACVACPRTAWDPLHACRLTHPRIAARTGA